MGGSVTILTLPSSDAEERGPGGSEGGAGGVPDDGGLSCGECAHPG